MTLGKNVGLLDGFQEAVCKEQFEDVNQSPVSHVTCSLEAECTREDHPLIKPLLFWDVWAEQLQNYE